MRMTVRLLAAVGLSAPALAQECLWSYHVATLPVVSSSAVYHSRLQRVLLVNTDSIGGVQIWSWEGGDWSLISASGPSRRYRSAAVYDSARDRIVLFGGNSNGLGLLNDTWEWDGTAWEQRVVAGPSAREYHGMVYDAARLRTVLFGGRVPPGVAINDTWEWDGSAWVLAASGGPPGPGLDGARPMAYDPLRARSLLATPSPLAHWEWDGFTWAQRPALSFASQMEFDTIRGHLIVFGAGVWEVNTITNQWVQRQLSPAPQGRAAFDVPRSRTVLAGQDRTCEFNSGGTILSPYIIQEPSGGGTFAPGATITLAIQGGGTEPLAYQWRRDHAPLTDGGNISGASTSTLNINPAGTGDSGNYDAIVSNQCLAVAPIYRTYVEVRTSTCYANCDDSTAPPILNVADFTCFLQRFAAGHLYADCDHGQLPPFLNVADFTCFLQRFAAGCP
jgi:hypothetical protein